MISNSINKLFSELELDIQNAYESGVTIPDAEKLAAKFLGAQIAISNELRNQDLDSRMKKSGVKAIRAAVYLAKVQESEKKPSDVMLEAHVNTSEVVSSQQELFDTSEVDKDLLQNYLNVARDGHVFFRTVARGRFE